MYIYIYSYTYIVYEKGPSYTQYGIWNWKACIPILYTNEWKRVDEQGFNAKVMSWMAKLSIKVSYDT